MAVVNRNSTSIANDVAVPSVFNNPGLGMGIVRQTTGTVATAADDTSASIGRFCRIPSNAVVRSVKLTCAIASSAGAIDVGIYDTTANGGAPIVDDVFADAKSLSSAALVDAQVLTQAYINANNELPLWKVLALASDPCKDFDVGYVISTTFNGGPTSLTCSVTYVV